MPPTTTTNKMGGRFSSTVDISPYSDEQVISTSITEDDEVASSSLPTKSELSSSSKLPLGIGAHLRMHRFVVVDIRNAYASISLSNQISNRTSNDILIGADQLNNSTDCLSHRVLPISFEWTLPRKNESLDEYLSRSNRIAINRREQSLSTKTSSVGIKRNKQTPIRSRSESYAMRQLSIGTGHYHKLLHRPTTIAPINNSTSIFASNDENDVMVSFKERTPSQVRVKLYDDDVDIQRLYGDADGDARVRHCCRRDPSKPATVGDYWLSWLPIEWRQELAALELLSYEDEIPANERGPLRRASTGSSTTTDKRPPSKVSKRNSATRNAQPTKNCRIGKRKATSNSNLQLLASIEVPKKRHTTTDNTSMERADSTIADVIKVNNDETMLFDSAMIRDCNICLPPIDLLPEYRHLFVQPTITVTKPSKIIRPKLLPRKLIELSHRVNTDDMIMSTSCRKNVTNEDDDKQHQHRDGFTHFNRDKLPAIIV